MTREEFQQHRADEERVLAGIPKPFAIVISRIAHDRGHGADEVISFMQEMVNDFAPAIWEYKESVAQYTLRHGCAPTK